VDREFWASIPGKGKSLGSSLEHSDLLQGMPSLQFIKYQSLGHEFDPSPPCCVEVQNDIPLLSMYALMMCTETTLPLCRWISVISTSKYSVGKHQ